MRSTQLFSATATVFTLLAVCLLALSAPAVAELPDPAGGIGDLEWGQNIATTPGFQKIKAKGDAEFFIRKDDPFTLYGKKMPRVIYGAKKGKLFAIYIHMDDEAFFKQLKEDFSERYGQPKLKPGKNLDTMQWTQGQFAIKLKEYKQTGLLKLGFYFEPLADAVNMANIDVVMDKIYDDQLEDFWIKGSPMLEPKE